MDVAHVEAVEKELDAFIERRTPKPEEEAERLDRIAGKAVRLCDIAEIDQKNQPQEKGTKHGS